MIKEPPMPLTPEQEADDLWRSLLLTESTPAIVAQLARLIRIERAGEGLAEAFDEARDAVLNQRHHIAENGMDGDQVNDVLRVMDDAFETALADYRAAKGGE